MGYILILPDPPRPQICDLGWLCSNWERPSSFGGGLTLLLAQRFKKLSTLYMNYGLAGSHAAIPVQTNNPLCNWAAQCPNLGLKVQTTQTVDVLCDLELL